MSAQKIRLKPMVLLAVVVLVVVLASLFAGLYLLNTRLSVLEARPYISVTLLESHGNETCSAPFAVFVFNLTATLTNGGGGPGFADALFQLDNSTVHDQTYYVGPDTFFLGMDSSPAMLHH